MKKKKYIAELEKKHPQPDDPDELLMSLLFAGCLTCVCGVAFLIAYLVGAWS